MTKLKIVRFDPKRASRIEWARFHAYRRKRHQETDPDDPILADATEEAWERQPDLDWKELQFAVFDANEPEGCIGWQSLEMHRPERPGYEENKHILWVWASLLPPYRRRGIGHALLRRAARFARQERKSVVISYSEEPDGMAFLRGIGAQEAQPTRQSRLRLDKVDWEMVEEWLAEGPQRSPQSTLRWFVNRIDDDAIEEFCVALTEVWNMMPRDDLEIGDEVFVPERIRRHETSIAKGGGTKLTAVTQEGNGRISGLTEMGYFPEQDWLIHQWMTGVRLPYRGRGLGKWLKAAMLLRVREQLPQVQVVRTGNASSNAPMLSINTRLGFQLYREGMQFQIGLDDLEANLARRKAGEEAVRIVEDGLAGI